MKIGFAIVVTLALSYTLTPLVQGQDQQPSPSPESNRRVVHRVSPQYPEAARKMRLGGTVRIVAVVGPDGAVKKVEPVGGSPLLVQAAKSAVTQWKFATGRRIA